MAFVRNPSAAEFRQALRRWPNQAVTSGQAISVQVPVGGSQRVRFRFLSSATGTLAFRLAYQDNTGTFTPYATGNPADVSVTANTETYQEITVGGETWLLVTFTPSATGTITWLDVSQV